MLMRYVEVWMGLSKYFVFVVAESDMVFDSPSPAEIVAYDSPPVNVTWFSASLSSMLKLFLPNSCSIVPVRLPERLTGR